MNAIDEKDIGLVTEFPEGQPVLRKSEDGQRFTCVRRGSSICVLADRCPHQGYPLSQGSLQGEILTCGWHNWKFDVTSGRCLSGGDAVRVYRARGQDGRVLVDVRIDEAAEREAAQVGLREGLFDNDVPRAVRDALRLAELDGGTFDGALTTLVEDTARRGRWGFGHELAMLADLLTWVDEGDADPAEVFALAAFAVGERWRREPPRPSHESRDGSADEAGDLTRISEALEAEDLGLAERRVRALVRAQGVQSVARALVLFACRDIIAYGHGAIYLAKGLELAARFPEAAEEILVAVAVSLGTGTRETALPVWAATQRALSSMNGVAREPAPKVNLTDRVEFEAAVLEGEAAATSAVVKRLAQGDRPETLLLAVGHAAAIRLSRFDPNWAERRDAEASILDVSHAVTFAEAAVALLPYARPEDAARLVVLAAAFVGKLRAADGPDAPSVDPSGDLLEAVQARREGPARARARRLERVERLEVYRALRPFAAHACFVRPIFVAHAVKVNQALYALERADPSADAGYLEAYIHLVAVRWPERSVPRVAAVAQKFLADGRPPVGIY